MANNSVAKKTQVVNPNFPIPDGLDYFVYEEEIDLDEVGEFGDTLLDEDGEIIYEDVPVATPDDTIPTPVIVGIISQTVRTAANGTQVVDVIVEVEDTPGISTYDIRATKI